MNSLPKVSFLTDREHEVLRCVAQGLSNAAIAARLGISSYTVRNHLTHIFEKLDVHSRSHAVALVGHAAIAWRSDDELFTAEPFTPTAQNAS